VLQLLRRRRLERRDPHTLRVDSPDDVTHDPALATGVHALDHEEHAAAVVLRAGEQAFLQLRQPIGAGREGRRPRGLAAVEAGRRARVDIREPEVRTHPQQVREPLRRDGIDLRLGLLLQALGLLRQSRRLLRGLRRLLRARHPRIMHRRCTGVLSSSSGGGSQVR
jgi:hypothetical protein